MRTKLLVLSSVALFATSLAQAAEQQDPARSIRITTLKEIIVPKHHNSIVFIKDGKKHKVKSGLNYSIANKDGEVLSSTNFPKTDDLENSNTYCVLRLLSDHSSDRVIKADREYKLPGSTTYHWEEGRIFIDHTYSTSFNLNHSDPDAQSYGSNFFDEKLTDTSDHVFSNKYFVPGQGALSCNSDKPLTLEEIQSIMGSSFRVESISNLDNSLPTAVDIRHSDSNSQKQRPEEGSVAVELEQSAAKPAI